MKAFLYNLFGFPAERMKFPGKVEKFDDINGVSGECFDVGNHCWSGVNINLQNYLNPYGFITAHMLNLGKKENVNPMTGEKDDERASYSFVALCKTGPLLVNARTGTGGATRAVFDLNLGGLGASTQLYLGKGGMNHVEGEVYTSSNHSYLQLKYLGSALGLCYSYHLFPDVYFGSEFVSTGNENRLRWSTKITGEDNTTTTITASRGLGPASFNIAYTHRLLEYLDISVGLDWTGEKKGWTSAAKFGFVSRLKLHGETENDGPEIERWPVSGRGFVDTNGKLGVVIEENTSESCALTACLSADLVKQTYDIGFGFNAM